MLGYLGRDTGELNDSSWLEEGVNLIAKRQEKLLEHRKDFEVKLPSALSNMKKDIEDHISKNCKKIQKDGLVLLEEAEEMQKSPRCRMYWIVINSMVSPLILRNLNRY